MKHFCKSRLTLIVPACYFSLLVVIFASTPAVASTGMNSLRGGIEDMVRIDPPERPAYGKAVYMFTDGKNWTSVVKGAVLNLPDLEAPDPLDRDGVDPLFWRIESFLKLPPSADYIEPNDFFSVHGNVQLIKNRALMDEHFNPDVLYILVNDRDIPSPKL